MGVSQQSIYRTADEMVRMSGRNAAQDAATYANELAEKHDDEGHKLWLRVCAAIEDLLAAGSLH